MPVFDHPARVTVETGSSATGIGAAVVAVAALAFLAALAATVVAFAARYALVLAVIGLVTAAVTATVVRLLLRRWTVLEMPGRLQHSRADAPLPPVVVTVHPSQVIAPSSRRALPTPAAQVLAQRPRTGTRNARHGA